MSVHTTDRTEDIDGERWHQLRRIARELARTHHRTAVVVRHAHRWLDQPHTPVQDHEIVVTWTVADAHLIRHQLRAHLPADRVFAAAPRVRYSGAGEPGEIPPPRRAHQPEHDDTDQAPNE